MAKKNQKQLQLTIQGNTIEVIKLYEEDYISLTNMVKNYGGSTQVQNWLRLKDTIEFLGVWEQMNNPSFNSIEFDRIKSEAGTSRYMLSAKEWIKSTNAVGITAKTGRYGSGTYAHKDIAFEFASWLSPVFKLLIIKEFQRLKIKEEELEQWDFRRFLSKANYKLHSSTIKESLIPKLNLAKASEWLAYADEADILNRIIFGQTAKTWRDRNPSKSKAGENQRDSATAKQLLILANLEAINANLISRGISKENRVPLLYEEARRQARTINEKAFEKQIDLQTYNQSQIPSEKPIKIDNPKGFDDTMDKIVNAENPKKSD